MARPLKMTSGYSGEKQAAKVITVDRVRRRVECALRDGGMVYAAVWEVPVIFRWPITGEVWMLRRDSGVWRLDSLMENIDTVEESTALSDLGEGEARVLVTSSTDGSGLKINSHYVTRVWYSAVGDGSSTAFTLRHGLGTANITVNLREEIHHTTLTANSYASDTTLSVASTTRFTTTGVLYLEDEIVTYTGKTADSFTGVTRAQEGTTAAVHLSGISVVQPVEILANDGVSVIDENRIRVEFDIAPTADQYLVVVQG